MKFLASSALTYLVTVSCLAGCGPPSSANIKLRKNNQDLRSQIAQLQRQHEMDEATINGLENSVPSVATLPPERLNRLFTTHGLRIGRLSGGADLDLKKQGDEALRIYVVPTDQTREPIKAAGSWTIEAFDLARGEDTRIGKWTHSAEEAKDLWNGYLNQYGYMLTNQWQTAPTHSELTVRVTFVDELTGRRFTAQRVVKVKPPPPPTTQTQPSD